MKSIFDKIVLSDLAQMRPIKIFGGIDAFVRAPSTTEITDAMRDARLDSEEKIMKVRKGWVNEPIDEEVWNSFVSNIGNETLKSYNIKKPKNRYEQEKVQIFLSESMGHYALLCLRDEHGRLIYFDEETESMVNQKKKLLDLMSMDFDLITEVSGIVAEIKKEQEEKKSVPLNSQPTSLKK